MFVYRLKSFEVFLKVVEDLINENSFKKDFVKGYEEFYDDFCKDLIKICNIFYYRII